MEADEEQLLRDMREQTNKEIAELRKEIGESMYQHEQVMCDKFRELREERGWSQTELSERLGDLGFEMHQTTVAKLEKGKRPLRVAELFALSQVFGLPPGAVFYMPRQGMTFDMEYMTDRLESLDKQMNDSRDMFLKNIEHHLDHQAELTYQRLEMVKTMRRAGVEVDSGRVVGGPDDGAESYEPYANITDTARGRHTPGEESEVVEEARVVPDSAKDESGSQRVNHGEHQEEG